MLGPYRVRDELLVEVLVLEELQHAVLDVLLDLGRLAHDVGDVVDLRQQQREEREAEHCDRDKADSAERGRNW